MPPQETKAKKTVVTRKSVGARTATATLSRIWHKTKIFNWRQANPGSMLSVNSFPQDRPSWKGKVKMCARWHIKGDCYDNCTRVTSHVTKDKIPADKKAGFLTFMKKCRKAAKTSN
jgi:hypothetical protein